MKILTIILFAVNALLFISSCFAVLMMLEPTYSNLK